jgi:hypothetical protein
LPVLGHPQYSEEPLIDFVLVQRELDNGHCPIPTEAKQDGIVTHLLTENFFKSCPLPYHSTIPLSSMLSKHDSQRRWYYSPKGAVYRDPEYNRQRVREWRGAHPDYARLTGGRPRRASPPIGTLKPFDDKALATRFSGGASQELMLSQPVVVEMYIVMLAAKALQEMIVTPARDRASISALF